MAYGEDITEAIPYVLSNPSISTTYSLSGESYDIAIGGLPFFLLTSDEAPYRRQTAAYRKDQVDQSTEPGEQTLTGWWLRSQSSFHGGSGINYYDPAIGEIVAYRSSTSKGVNVWDKGKVTLLPKSDSGHVTTGAIASNGRPNQKMSSIKWGGTSGILLQDEYDLDKIDSTGTSTHFVDYNAGSASPVYSSCNDGTHAYWITNTSTKKTIYKKPLTGSSASTADEVKVIDAVGSISNAIMEYTKERIVVCADNSVYEVATTTVGGAFPTALYTHPSSSHVYTSITASGPAIYIAGYNGIQSTIIKFTISNLSSTSTGGNMPAMNFAVVAAELPAGEIVHKIHYYLGYMLIGTSKGVRAAVVSDQDGSINYGPIIVHTSQPCYDFATRDNYVWCATGVGDNPGLIRIDLGNEIEPLRFAYANDLYFPSVTTFPTTACAFLDGTDRIAYATASSGGNNGATYIEAESELLTTGYIETGRIRYSTIESKVFKLLKSRVDNQYGGFSIQSIDFLGNEYNIGSFAERSAVPEVNIAYPQGSQEYISLRFTLTRSDTNTSLGPIFTGYQLKALPAVPRQRIIQLPLSCYDHETDKFGLQVGYDGAAFARLVALEELENNGDSVKIEDYRNDESYTGIIEEVSFINRTPTDKRFSGFGGVLLVTFRTL